MPRFARIHLQTLHNLSLGRCHQPIPETLDALSAHLRLRSHRQYAHRRIGGHEWLDRLVLLAQLRLAEHFWSDSRRFERRLLSDLSNRGAGTPKTILLALDKYSGYPIFAG